MTSTSTASMPRLYARTKLLNARCTCREWSQISLSAESMKQGAFFLSMSHVLQTALFEVVKTLQFKMSWGTATLYIHVRDTDPWMWRVVLPV